MAQTIFEVNYQESSLGGPSTSDSNTSLSTSNTARLGIAFPKGPQHVGQDSAPSMGDGPAAPKLNRAGYRDYYETVVMGGNNLNYSEKSLNGTAHSRNYLQNGPPILTDLNMNGLEPPHKGPAATIVNSGIGPNLNVVPAMALIGWPIDQPDETSMPSDVVIPHAPPHEDSFPVPSIVPFAKGDGSASPHNTSIPLSVSSLHIVPPGYSKLNVDEG